MQLTQLRGGLFPRYKLLNNYAYKFAHNGHLCEFVIPEGFEYDGATMGSFLFWRKSLHTSPHTIAHDWGYSKLGKVEARYLHGGEVDTWSTFNLSRNDLDNIFLSGIKQQVNVQSWRSFIARGGIEIFGAILWYSRKSGIIN